jgi:hypothetical protein
MVPRAIYFRKFNAAATIQKYLRGFLVHHYWRTAIDKQRIKENLSFFDDMRERMHMDAVKVIKKCWNVYKIRRE